MWSLISCFPTISNCHKYEVVNIHFIPVQSIDTILSSYILACKSKQEFNWIIVYVLSMSNFVGKTRLYYPVKERKNCPANPNQKIHVLHVQHFGHFNHFCHFWSFWSFWSFCSFGHFGNFFNLFIFYRKAETKVCNQIVLDGNHITKS